ncbi:unnamed protein product [Zymoseptoria tritici ST99CH_1A5]|uniref:Uncharacterized protein n=1 Tax=Zymoseptoria tritici ST99CH_1A5 TaxID=1276529 RepID=A0A1Y6LY94_ZYMTR|nr:unnamed protein product [Zymoseptoria tritici ST99CH_1A5]
MPAEKAPKLSLKGGRSTVDSAVKRARVADPTKAAKLAAKEGKSLALQVAPAKQPKPARKRSSTGALKPPLSKSKNTKPLVDYSVVETPTKEVTSQPLQESTPKSYKRLKSTPPAPISIYTIYKLVFNKRPLKDFKMIYTGKEKELQTLVTKARGMVELHTERQGLQKRLINRLAKLVAKKHGKQSKDTNIDFKDGMRITDFMDNLDPFIKHFLGHTLSLEVTESWQNTPPSGDDDVNCIIAKEPPSQEPNHTAVKGRRNANDRTISSYSFSNDLYSELIKSMKCTDIKCPIYRSTSWIGCMQFRG